MLSKNNNICAKLRKNKEINVGCGGYFLLLQTCKTLIGKEYVPSVAISERIWATGNIHCPEDLRLGLRGAQPRTSAPESFTPFGFYVRANNQTALSFGTQMC